MILTCPNCATQYFAADETLVGEGRNVRCTACGHDWTVNVGPAGPVGAPGAHEIYLARKRQRARRARGLARLMAWTFALLVFAGAVTGAILYRNEVVRYWPESATAYRLAGLKVNRFGLEIEGVTTERTFEGTTPILTVTGNATNVTRVSQPTAQVAIVMFDEAGTRIAAYTTSLGPDAIPAAGTLPFTAVITDPPLEAWSLEVSLQDPGGRGEGEPVSVQAGRRADAAPGENP